MKNKSISRNTLRIYLIAAIIAVSTASLLPFNSSAASNSYASQDAIILNTTGNLPDKGMDARLIHLKMAVTGPGVDVSEVSISYQPAKIAVAEGINDLPVSIEKNEVSTPIVIESAAPVGNNDVADPVVTDSAAPIVNDVAASNPVETVEVSAPVPTVSGLTAFAAKVTNGNSGQITGLYSENLFALSVVQQSGDASWVSRSGNTATQFSMASGLGFLAHNDLAGSLFFYLYGGAPITVVYGDGQTQSYRVSQIRKFQALSPDSPYSDFVDLASGSTLSATDLFYETYGVSGQMILQTCIASNGNSSWGRLFVIATPAD